MQNVLGIVGEAAARHGLVRVSRITLTIGEFAGVDDGALRIAFEIARRGTVAAEAELEVERPPLILYCRACENEYVGEIDDLRCPTCLGEDFEVVMGRELEVKSIEGE